ncbi:MAG TPA: TIGR03435 family protein [Bryobacteraceae bacterium]|jgi:uncharacterized protein (TIGR03435 family)|nr:TIGR03435 family protein [Bryobacteraceae bacterium]
MNRALKFLIALAFLPLAAFAQNLTGTWQGTVRNPDGNVDLRTVLIIQSSEGNPIKGNFYSIDQTYLVFPATINVQGAVLKISIPGIGATWDGKLSADGGTLTGSLKGFSSPVTWTMKRVGPDQAWTIPQPPARPKPLASTDPVFEVASIKRSSPDSRERGLRLQGGTISVMNMPLTDILSFVYDLHPHQIIGLPAWATSEKYDISAKAEGEGQPTRDQLTMMLRKLLAERFQLAVHDEQRELPVYTVNVAKGGIKISPNDPKTDPTKATTGVIFRGPGSVLLNNVTMDDFSKMLQQAALDRPVINQTGISGKYDFSLVWSPPQLAIAAPNPNALTPTADAPPDLYTAVQQQLGFRIDAAKLRIGVVVIDKVERPSNN